MGYLGLLLASPPLSELEAAQQKTYVTYTLPFQEPLSVTILESRGLILAEGTTGMRTWEAALRLGTYCTQNPTLVQGKSILELGAGTGFVSLLCAKCLDAQYTFATDGDVGVVESIQTNMFLNGLEGRPNMDAAVYRWGHSLASTILEREDTGGDRKFDVAFGADVVSRCHSINVGFSSN